MITGKDLIDAGFTSGRWFAKAIEAANAELSRGAPRDACLAVAARFAPPPALQLAEIDARPLFMNIEADGDLEATNVEAVRASMRMLRRTPVVRSGAVMPDACPAGPPGTIPVGGLAEIVDEIVPYGSIMAGDWEFEAPWRVKKRAKLAAAGLSPSTMRLTKE